MTRTSSHHFAPELVADVEGAWKCSVSILDKARISKEHRIAEIPPAYTQAQQLARLHELEHAAKSPRNWLKVRTTIMSMGDEGEINLDADAVVKIAKMLEENRIDWRLWRYLGIDMRPCREAINWGAMTLPDNDPLEATCWVLQLAWTVWGSDGTWTDKDIPHYPEAREGDPRVKEFFDGCWAIVQSHDSSLALAVLSACVQMYVNGTHEVRDQATYELAKYFLKVEEYLQPEPTPEEKELQDEAEAEEKEKEAAQKEDKSGGDFNGVETYGHWQLHDHTAGRRRPMVRVRKRYTAVDQGTILKYPHRYLLDKCVFGRRQRQTGSILIDMSGSMTWTNDDMMQLLDRMPQLWIGGYSGHHVPDKPAVRGRICIHAKAGRFNEFTGIEPTANGGNVIDLEALQYLARQPEPRFWLSDGAVVGGVLHGQYHPQYPHHPSGYMAMAGRLIYEVNRVMKKYNIMRVANKADMVKLFARQRVKLYKSTIFSDEEINKLSEAQGRNVHWTHNDYYPAEMPCESVFFQL